MVRGRGHWWSVAGLACRAGGSARHAQPYSHTPRRHTHARALVCFSCALPCPPSPQLHPPPQVRAASPDTLDTVGQLTPVFLGEISKTFGMAATTGEQRERQAELQGQLCGVLQVRLWV